MTTLTLTTVTAAQVVEKMIALAALHPTRTFVGACAYADDDGRPLCLVAHVLSELELPLPACGSLENEATCDADDFLAFYAREGYAFEPGAVRALRAAQVSQDERALPRRRERQVFLVRVRSRQLVLRVTANGRQHAAALVAFAHDLEPGELLEVRNKVFVVIRRRAHSAHVEEV